MSWLYSVTAVSVPWASRAQHVKPTLTTAKTTTVRMEPPAWTESTTTPVFVPPTTLVRSHNTPQTSTSGHFISSSIIQPPVSSVHRRNV